jgi:hypothetical protein
LQQLIATIEQQVEDNLTQAKEANATISKLHIEKHDKTARMEIARSLEQIQALASPAGVNNYADKLSELRRRVAEADGRAEASARIAGTDTAARSAKLRQAARTKVQNSDLLRELGLISDKPPVSETPAAVADKPATLPEKD